MKRVIWSNIDLKLTEDWLEYFAERNAERVADGDEPLTEDEMYEWMVDDNDMFLDDERDNLDIQLDNPILVIGSLGLWNGRVNGYRIIESGNIKDILYADADYAEWYSDGHNIKCTAHHHDGTNYYEYREIRDMDKIHNLTDKLYNQEEVDRDFINRYTKSILPYVKEVYGW